MFFAQPAILCGSTTAQGGVSAHKFQLRTFGPFGSGEIVTKIMTLVFSTVHEQRQRPAVRVVLCCARAAFSAPCSVTRVAVTAIFYRPFPSLLFF